MINWTLLLVTCKMSWIHSTEIRNSYRFIWLVSASFQTVCSLRVDPYLWLNIRLDGSKNLYRKSAFSKMPTRVEGSEQA